jgi:putative ABC transport system permease protein
VTGTSPSPRSARRAVVRWAWRLFRREWRQQALVLVLMVVAVAVAVAGAAIAWNAASGSRGRAGTAGAIVHLDPRDGSLASRVAAAEQRFGPVEVVTHETSAIPGTSARLDVRGQAPHGRFSAPTLALRHGRLPRAADEVALTATAADLLDTSVGHRVTLVRRTYEVVGLVENPADLDDQFALVAPHAPRGDETVELLVGSAAPPPSAIAGPSAGAAPGTGFRVEVVDRPHEGVAAIVLVVSALAMALVGLIAAASFVVLAQRRQRQLGLLAAIGATDRHLRLTMVATGAIVGLVAAVVGGALGLAGWLTAAPAVEQAAGHRIDRFALPWNLVGGCLALAVAAATAAAWWPARLQARVPVTAALSRRPPRPAPVHRSLALAAVFLGAGVYGVWAAQPTGEHVRPLLLMAGLLGIVVGVVLAAPSAIRLLARPAQRLPLAGRVALRGLVRQQSRTAAALAAVTLGLGISVGVVGVAAANQDGADAGNLASDQLVIKLPDFPTSVDASTDAAQLRPLDAAAERVAHGIDHQPLLRLDTVTNPSTMREPGLGAPITVARQLDPHSFHLVGIPYLATPALLARLGIDPSAVQSDTDLLTADRRTPLVLLDDTMRGSSTTPHVQRVPLPEYTSAPRFLVSAAAVARNGWHVVPSGWLVEARHPLTGDQIRAARHAAADVGLEIEVRDQQDGLAVLRRVATGAGLALALAIVAMTVGLLRAEAAAEVRTLTATGARARTLRAITAWSAGALATAGVGLSLVGAYAALVAAFHSELDLLTPLPVGPLLVVLLGLPAAAVAGGLLLTRPPREVARAALD